MGIRYLRIFVEKEHFAKKLEFCADFRHLHVSLTRLSAKKLKRKKFVAQKPKLKILDFIGSVHLLVYLLLEVRIKFSNFQYLCILFKKLLFIIRSVHLLVYLLLEVRIKFSNFQYLYILFKKLLFFIRGFFPVLDHKIRKNEITA